MASKTRKFEGLLEAVPDALVGMDQTGVIVFVNHQTETLFRFDRDDMVGQPIQMLVPEYLWEAYSEHREDYFADPRSRSSGLDLQLSGRLKDGAELPVNISLSHLDTGDILLVLTAQREVNRHNEAIENSKLLAAIVENSNDAIIAKTLDGMVTSWNPAVERMYGYSREEMDGTSIDRLSPGDRTGEISAILARIKAGLDVEPFETLRVRKDETVFPVMSPVKAVIESARSMIESSLDALVAISAEGLITDANKATVKATGIPCLELIGPLLEVLGQERGGVDTGIGGHCDVLLQLDCGRSSEGSRGGRLLSPHDTLVAKTVRTPRPWTQLTAAPGQ